MLIVDAHLDLAYNVTRGRDPRMPAAQQPVVDKEIATVGLPDLRAGGVGLICATIFCAPAGYGDRVGYTSAEEARQQALAQLAWYRSCVDEGLIRFVTGTTGVPPVPQDQGQDARGTLDAILLLEGADALRSPADVEEWFNAGLRIVGLAWKRTRYAGGTGAPGPLTPDGRALVRELDRMRIIHDASHLAEESLWNLLDLSSGPVIASHSNCRAIVGEGDRHLSDEMIRALAQRGGVIGVNFYDKFLLPRSEHGRRRATLADVVAHVSHICELAGSADHVGLGTDMDGGLGREQIPVEIRTSADLPRVAESLSAAGFGDKDVNAIMGGNWRRFFAAALPVASAQPNREH
jgi:membrane dipeptidase